MTRTRWKFGVITACVFQFLLTPVVAVDASQCSTQNTGSGGKSTNSIYMTNGLCHDTCAGYAFAITQWQNCWCSNEAPGATTGVGSCNQDCPAYPTEKCGNQEQGLFSYIALGKAPSGTVGAGGGGGGGGSSGKAAPSAQAPSSVFVPPSSAPVPQPSTLVIVSSAPPQTVVQTQASTSISVFTPPPSSVVPVIITQTQQNTETKVSSVPPSTVLQDASTSVVDGPTSTVTPTPLVVTSAQAVTVSGSVVTHVVTSTPVPPPALSQTQANEMPKQTRQGLSNGAVAGAVIGAFAGVALLAGLIFLCVWRRRKSQPPGDSEGSPPKRNASVLSRVGLLGSNRHSGGNEPTLPQIMTSGVAADDGPHSALTNGSSQMSESRRNSRPLFSDARLNPNALMTQTNLSRTSVSTLQDAQDYSRPLEVRNPDTH